MKFSKTWNLESKENESSHQISLLWSVLFALSALIFYFLVYLNWSILPDAFLIQDEASNKDRFIAEIAYNNLKTITDLGPRVTGSHQNEVLAVEFLNRTIQEIISKSNQNHKIELDFQKAYGNLFVDIKNYPVTSVYRGIQNIVVKLTPSAFEPENYLLLNAHFDTVPTSPGAGDDATMVTVMLEILRKISSGEKTFKHGIVFLFNGLEENTLQASHAFITSHHWFPKVRAVINLEGASGGNRELMFQAGPEFPFLMRYYSKYIHHPFCNAVAEEVFQAGLVPSATDYENFVSFGKIPGMDFAFNANGYLYHTKYDSLDTIPLETLQATGDNILDLTKALADAPELDDIEKYRGGKAIFFDFLNWFMIYYTDTVATTIHSLAIVAALAILVGSFWVLGKQKEIETQRILSEFGVSFTIQILSIAVGLCLSLLIAVIVDAAGRSMSWFSSTWLLFGLYFCPIILCLCAGPLLYITYRKLEQVDLQSRVIIFLHSQYLITIIVLLVLTSLQKQTSYIFFMIILFYSITTIVNMTIKFSSYHWIYVHILGQIVPFVYFCSTALLLFNTFIAMTAREDSQSNPDLKMAVFSFIMTVLMFAFLTPLVSLMRKPLYFIGFVIVFIVFNFMMMATPVGFPFREATSPQRHYIFHMERKFYNFNGTLRKEDSKIYMHPQDRHNPQYIMHEVPEMKNAVLLGEECEKELYCGIPYYMNRNHRQSSTSYWLPAGKPVFKHPVEFKQKRNSKLSENTTRFEFSIQGTDHMGFYVSPVSECKIKSWSFSNKVPMSGKKWNDQEVHYINFVYGSDNSTYDFFIDVESAPDKVKDSPSFHISVHAQYMHHDEDRTEEYNTFLSHFPKFAHIAAYQSYYENWVF